jgi:glycosyltransferase involved in cell wall biosynthesis
MNKLPLTICILTHRSDELFIQALQSAQLAQEVLVLDNQSHNHWQTLKKEYAFVLQSLDGELTDFAAARNLGLKLASQPWVLFLDSDETLTPGSKELLEEILDSKLTSAFSVTRVDTFLGQKINYGEARLELIRLLNKDRCHYTQPVHEVPVVSGPISKSQLVILHQPHASLSSFIEKVGKYASLVAQSRPANLPRIMLELIFYPPLKFLYNYFVRLGFLDGWRGLTYAVVMSLHSLFVRIFQYEQLIHAKN